MSRLRSSGGIILCMILVLGVLAGCSSSSSSNKNKVTIDFWYTWGGKEAEVLQELIDEYNESQDEIFVKGLAQGDIQKQMTAIVGGNPPDLATHYDENRLASWAERGAMKPLDEFMERDNFDFDDFLPSARTAVQYKEKTYGLPIVMNSWMLFYNKDIFAEAGLDGPPETIQELEEYNKILSKVENGRIERMGIHPARNPYMWLNASGGKLWDDETKEVTPFDPGFKATIEMNKRMWDEYGSDGLDRFASSEGQYASAQNSFFSGKFAMSFDGEWLATFIKQYAPNLNYGIAPMPYDANKPETKNSGFINVGVFYIPEGADQPDEAWEFLKWLTAKENMVRFAAGLGNLPPRISAADDPIFDDVPAYTEFMEYVSNGQMYSVPQVPFLEEYIQEIFKTQEDILRDKISVEEGLTKLKEKMQPIADKMNE
ncbi:ABC transporter substrate-binding protein [Sutcliffiella halmapala]|uniref:ABC transporter substrate-binding protein n=1 Tax=Sutcliffiella halmapala TaxID=79882 RepID=UPI000995A99F|nr:ABC transporter substrate-binding protein [Sutcliffiella halmapala]